MANNVNMYGYVAASNPYFAKSLLHKYGYVVDKEQSLGSALQQLVAYEGEPALMEIVENNPDKDLFMEYFDKKFPRKKEECGCGKDSVKLMDYMNFSGQMQAAQLADNKKLTTETSVVVLAGAILIAFAIILKK